MSINPENTGAPRPTRTPPVARAGFSLLEVMLSLVLLMLLAGGLFGLVDACLQATYDMRWVELRRQETVGLIDLCRRSFAALPARATVELRARQEEGEYFPELVLRDASGCMAWSDEDYGANTVVLGVRPELGGLVNLSVLRLNEDETTEHYRDPDQEELWLALLSDLHEVRWEFYEQRSDRWTEEWTEGMGRPTLIRLCLLLAGEDEEIGTTFWLPPVKESSTTSTSSGSSGGGGGGTPTDSAPPGGGGSPGGGPPGGGPPGGGSGPPPPGGGGPRGGPPSPSIRMR